jgi:uncharacterized protein
MTPMLSGECDIIEINRTFILADDVLPDDAALTQPISAVGNIVNLSGYMKLTLKVNVKYETVCARCLRPLPGETLELSFEKTIAVSGTLENEDADEVISDYVLINENKLDLAQITEEQLLLEFPLRHLCSEDCRGLCPKCGHDLNESDCGCHTAEIDPRLEVLKTLIDKPDDKNEEIDD